jgi:hypothetical protein
MQETLVFIFNIPEIQAIGKFALFFLGGIWIFIILNLIVDALKSFNNKILGFIIALACGIILIPGIFLYYLFKPDPEIKASKNYALQCHNCKTCFVSPVKFCSNCGRKLLKECDNCHFFQGTNNKFCVNCGNTLFKYSQEAEKLEEPEEEVIPIDLPYEEKFYFSNLSSKIIKFVKEKI